VSTELPDRHDAAERVLAERARLLARPLARPDRTTDDEMLVLEAGGERYAVELAVVERVHPVEALTSLPGLRPPWAGLVSLRGEILPALDLPAYLGRPPMPPPDGPRRPGASCAVVAAGGLRVALLSEAPVALRSRPPGGLARTPPRPAPSSGSPTTSSRSSTSPPSSPTPRWWWTMT
jgi:hypothetical protein